MWELFLPGFDWKQIVCVCTCISGFFRIAFAVQCLQLMTCPQKSFVSPQFFIFLFFYTCQVSKSSNNMEICHIIRNGSADLYMKALPASDKQFVFSHLARGMIYLCSPQIQIMSEEWGSRLSSLSLSYSKYFVLLFPQLVRSLSCPTISTIFSHFW